MDQIYIIVSSLIDVDIVAAWQIAAVCRAGSMMFPRIFANKTKKTLIKLALKEISLQMSPRNYLLFADYYAYEISTKWISNYFAKAPPFSQLEVNIIFNMKKFKKSKEYWFLYMVNTLQFELCNAIIQITNNTRLIPIQDEVQSHDCIFNDEYYAYDFIYVLLTGDNISNKRSTDNNSFGWSGAYEKYWDILYGIIIGKTCAESAYSMLCDQQSSWDKYFNLYRLSLHISNSGQLKAWDIESSRIIMHAIKLCSMCRGSYRHYQDRVSVMIMAAIKHGHPDYLMALKAAAGKLHNIMH